MNQEKAVQGQNSQNNSDQKKTGQRKADQRKSGARGSCFKQLNDLLAGIPMTIAGGIFLVLSFVAARTGVALPADPAWVTVFISGIPLLYLAVWRVIHNPGISKISSALLITIAMFAAIAIGDLFAAGEVAFIMAVGAILEDMTTDRAKKGLKKLICLVPAKARRITEGKEELIPPKQVAKGDVLRILAGETIPVDGIILKGETSVDQSVMTGEALPVDKGVGEEVYSGTINRFGVIEIAASRVGEDSSLQKLIRMVQEAENKKAPMQRIADRCASWLVPIALAIAVIAGLATGDIVRAVTVLVVFCPCALVLATPTAIMAAIGQATRHGVIIKSGEALEKMGKVDTIVFDKTGTLTYGKLKVCQILSFDGNMDENRLLSLTAGAESKSEHPLGRAIVDCAKERNVPLLEAEEFQMYTGRGITARILGKKLFCGNEAYLKENGIMIDGGIQSELRQLQEEGKAAVLAAEEGSCKGLFALSDELRPQAGDMITELHSMGIKTVLLTGDNKRTADYIAGKAGISQVCAELLPQEKVQKLEGLQSEGSCVCMIGDGVNDAPALKTASVGVSMGSMGSDIAVEASDIALMSDDLSKIPYLKRLSHATVKTIRFSITLSMCINFIAVTLSVLGVLTPTTGALVHNAGSCFVVLLAALLYDRKFE